MGTLETIESADDGFRDWLSRHIGQCRWLVGRKSKKKLSVGYDTFFTERRFKALQKAYDQEIAAMNDAVTLPLTEPNEDLAKKRKSTFPGMAFWGGTGPADRTCRQCTLWAFDGYMAGSGLLRDVPCAQYQKMTNGTVGARIPHYARSCKYFSQREPELPVNNPK